MKDAIVAKVAMQAADFYQEASRAATHYELRGVFEKVFIIHHEMFSVYLFLCYYIFL